MAAGKYLVDGKRIVIKKDYLCTDAFGPQDGDVKRPSPLEALVAVHLVVFLGWLLGRVWWIDCISKGLLMYCCFWPAGWGCEVAFATRGASGGESGHLPGLAAWKHEVDGEVL